MKRNGRKRRGEEKGKEGGVVGLREWKSQWENGGGAGVEEKLASHSYSVGLWGGEAGAKKKKVKLGKGGGRFSDEGSLRNNELSK